MKFGVIWESQDVAKENKFNYYYQPVHYCSAAKMLLPDVNSKNRGNMYSYALRMLQDIRGRNSDAGESNSRIVGVTSLQVTMYNCDRYSGANQALNSIIYDLLRNRYAFTVNLETLCWFGCMSYLRYPKVPGEIVILAINTLGNYSFNSMICKTEVNLKKRSLREIIQVLVLRMRERFRNSLM
jgi:hypothetical protein